VPRPVSLARGSTVGVARQRALRAGAGAELGEELHDYRRLQLHGLPDDGNRYELVRGALFGTPAPRRSHEIILARLSELLAPFVRENGLGLVFHRAVMRFDASEVEPDLAVQQAHSIAEGNGDSAPTPNLVVEVLSGVTRRRDLDAKRALYLDAGISEYWVIDEDTKSIRVIRNGPHANQLPSTSRTETRHRREGRSQTQTIRVEMPVEWRLRGDNRGKISLRVAGLLNRG